MAATKSPRITILFCMFLVLICCEVNSASQRYCGDDLTDVLNRVCPNGLAKKFKRSEMSSLMLENDYNAIENAPVYAFRDFPFLAKLNGDLADLMAKTRRRRMGAYDECCRKACTYDELAAYCLQ